MIATQVTVYRAASIAGVLAASAFVSAPAREHPPSPRIDLSSIALGEGTIVPRIENVAVQEPAPPPLGGHWQGTCHEGEHGWPDMPITLALTIDADGNVDATGTLAFVGRRTYAKLRGGVLDDRFIVHGEMKERDGIYSVWRIEVNCRFKGQDRIVGRFVEVYPRELGGSAVMCTFDWRR